MLVKCWFNPLHKEGRQKEEAKEGKKKLGKSKGHGIVTFYNFHLELFLFQFDRDNSIVNRVLSYENYRLDSAIQLIIIKINQEL